MRICFSFDDGAKEDLRIAQLLLEHGFRDVIFYIPSEWHSLNLSEGRDPLSYADVLYLDEQFEVGAHSITHRLLTRIPYDQAVYEILYSQEILEDILGHEITSFCPPRGYLNDELKEVVAGHYETCRSTLVGNVGKTDPLWQVTTAHIGNVGRKEYLGTTWLAEAERLIDSAGKDSTLHFWGHSWEISKNDAWEDFETLLERLYEVAHS